MSNPTLTASPPRRPEAASGFTLIELLVVGAILGVVATAIGLGLSAGLRVWENARAVQDEDGPTLLALSVLERDLRNSFPFYAVPFEGSPDSVSFPVRRVVSKAPKDTVLPEGGRIGRVSYRYDASRRALVRREEGFPAGPAREETLLNRVSQFRLRYARIEDAPIGAWQETWMVASNSPPRVLVGLSRTSAAGTGRWERTILIPVHELVGRGNP